MDSELPQALPDIDIEVRLHVESLDLRDFDLSEEPDLKFWAGILDLSAEEPPEAEDEPKEAEDEPPEAEDELQKAQDEPPEADEATPPDSYMNMNARQFQSNNTPMVVDWPFEPPKAKEATPLDPITSTCPKRVPINKVKMSVNAAKSKKRRGPKAKPRLTKEPVDKNGNKKAKKRKRADEEDDERAVDVEVRRSCRKRKAPSLFDPDVYKAEGAKRRRRKVLFAKKADAVVIVPGCRRGLRDRLGKMDVDFIQL